jgi:MFS family permease
MSLILIGAALFLASIGNPIYAVANQTAVLEAAEPSNRGSLMATRFGLVQTASILGVAAGGLITKEYGPLAAYGVIGIGLVLLAMYAIAAGRSTVNPLHGAAFEEASRRVGVPQNPADRVVNQNGAVDAQPDGKTTGRRTGEAERQDDRRAPGELNLRA